MTEQSELIAPLLSAKDGGPIDKVALQSRLLRRLRPAPPVQVAGNSAGLVEAG
jgi:hypothetical protein